MKFTKIKSTVQMIFLSFFAGIAVPVFALGADVDVYAEGSISGAELAVYVYADVNVDTLLSYGVSLNYDPSQLVVLQVEKDPETIPYSGNTTKWYLGQSSASYRNNPVPDHSVPGKIIIIGGKLDPASPKQGVAIGTRLFLAMIKFGPADTLIPDSPLLSLSYARGDGTSSYKNFVRLGNDTPQILDGAQVEFRSVVVRKQGDADGNGTISPRDVNAVKLNIGRTNVPCYMDCDGNGSITPSDMNCIKSKI